MSLLYSTAYHPQTDGSSERTNQTAEIALRFFMHVLDSPTKWPETLPTIQSFLNSSTSPGPTPTEIAYGFTINRPPDSILPNVPGISHLATRVAAKDVIDFVQISAKFHYDRSHQPITDPEISCYLYEDQREKSAGPAIVSLESCYHTTAPLQGQGCGCNLLLLDYASF